MNLLEVLVSVRNRSSHQTAWSVTVNGCTNAVSLKFKLWTDRILKQLKASTWITRHQTIEFTFWILVSLNYDKHAIRNSNGVRILNFQADQNLNQILVLRKVRGCSKFGLPMADWRQWPRTGLSIITGVALLNWPTVCREHVIELLMELGAHRSFQDRSAIHILFSRRTSLEVTTAAATSWGYSGSYAAPEESLWWTCKSTTREPEVPKRATIDYRHFDRQGDRQQLWLIVRA